MGGSRKAGQGWSLPGWIWLEADVCVVGAGLAGLAAARDLERRAQRRRARGARPRRRAHAQPAAPAGQVVEVGGQWIGPTQDRLAALAAELGVDATRPTARARTSSRSGARSRRYRGRIPRSTPAVLADVAQAQPRLDRMARGCDRGALAGRARRRWDGQTFATWIARNTVTRGGRALLEGVVEAVWAAEPGDLSLLHVLFYISSAGAFDAADRHGGRRAAGPLRGRLAARWRCGWRRRSTCASARPSRGEWPGRRRASPDGRAGARPR